MKQTDCSRCGNTAALNDTLVIEGEAVCVPCAENLYPDKESLGGKKVEKRRDPTVCAWCSKDNGDAELPKISVYPVCEPCAVNIKNRTLPLWVKGFFGAVVILTVFGFFWNMRYFESHKAVEIAIAEAGKKHYGEASRQMAIAGEKVPEVVDLASVAAFYKGVDLLIKDSNTAAVSKFKLCIDKLPADFNVKELLLKAQMGEAFDKKDYDLFLVKSKEALDYDKTADGWASVSSAYACLYAVKGQDSLKMRSEEFLRKAWAIDSTSDQAKEYRNRIEYRLATRQIVTYQEFHKKYPHGWTKP